MNDVTPEEAKRIHRAEELILELLEMDYSSDEIFVMMEYIDARESGATNDF